MNRKKLMWLASYPKSGNTWMRAFLANYLVPHDWNVPLSLKELNRITSGEGGPEAIKRITGKDHQELSTQENFEARQKFLEERADLPTPTFIKTHQANVSVGDLHFIPPELTRTAIYIVRNPLDMIISYADHMGITVEKGVKQIASPMNKIGGGEKRPVQFLGNWSKHVASWITTDKFPVQMLRYEDMLEDPERSFGLAIKAIGAPLDKSYLVRAIEATQFDRLAAQEADDGFVELSPNQEKFFRKGKTGQWEDELPGALIDQIKSDHGETMKFLKYL